MITQAELKELLNYNPDTGVFTWNVSKPGRSFGSIAGTRHVNGYTHIQLNKKIYKAHRLAWLYVHGYFPECIDHINNDRDDNRIENLREATVTQNNHNSKLSKNNTSGIKGVSWHKKSMKWCATIGVYGKTIYLGLFDNLELAELVITEARNKYHGEFVNNG
jgi:hypothetical protein